MCPAIDIIKEVTVSKISCCNVCNFKIILLYIEVFITVQVSVLVSSPGKINWITGKETIVIYNLLI